jgi:hypothetical protein
MSQDMLTKVKKIEDIGRSNLAHLVFRIIGSVYRNFTIVLTETTKRQLEKT